MSDPRHIFVDPARGNDLNDGTNDLPLASVNEAFARSVQQEGHIEVRDETGKLLAQYDVIPLRDDPLTPRNTSSAGAGRGQ